MASERRWVAAGGAWAGKVGYSRATRVGGIVAVAGTTAPGKDAYEQTKNTLEVIGKALRELGCDWKDVVRSRIYVVDIERDWEAIGKAHHEVLGNVRPASTMLQISKLVDPNLVVEIEVDAVVPEARL